MKQTTLNQEITLLPNDEFKAEIKVRESNLKEQEDILRTVSKSQHRRIIYYDNSLQNR